MASWPDDWWKDQRVAVQLSHCFADHVLGLGVGFTVDGKPAYDWLTGFLLQLGDLVFWVTAGHVIDRIQELLAHPRVKLHAASFNDDFPHPSASNVPVPLGDLAIYRDKAVDFGAVFLRPGYATPLLANSSIKPLTPEIWHAHEKAKPDGYYLVGIPSQWCEVEEIARSDKGVLVVDRARLVCAPVERIDPEDCREGDGFWGDPKAFYGKVLYVWKSRAEKLDDIAGMSGGPILSIERTQQSRLKYRLFGVQSVWLPGRRILRAEPISRVVDIIKSWFSPTNDP
ncbi:MAG: hypothetical protein MUP47_02135 [Phycisphaerae bacterium]|nr:hypothetical protein [Phycisphaerae bacterium]